MISQRLIAGSGSAEELPCEQRDPVLTTFVVHSRRGEVQSAQLYFPQLTTEIESGTVAIRLTAYNAQHDVIRETLLPLITSPLYSTEQATVIDLAQFVNAETGFFP